MIVYPLYWNQDYSRFIGITNSDNKSIINNFIRILQKTLEYLRIKHLLHNGSIESTILLHLLTEIYGENNIRIHSIHYSIGSNYFHHPPRIDSSYYKQQYQECIIDGFSTEDQSARFFKSIATDHIICCGGINEFMCGYNTYNNYDQAESIYKRNIKFLPATLAILHKESGSKEIYLPYLSCDLINLMSKIPLRRKNAKRNQDKIMIRIARELDIPNEIIIREEKCRRKEIPVTSSEFIS